MDIGGFQKNSMIDYPNKIACVIFTSGCNFQCAYCHNPSLVNRTAKPVRERTIFSFLKKRELLDGVVITGGEPTIQKDLISFCQKIKETGFSLKLDTNGSNPDVLKELFKQKLIDFTAMDVKTDLKNYNFLAGKKFDPQKIKASISLIMKKSPDYEFRTTCLKPFVDEKIIENIGKLISGAKQYALQPCSEKISQMMTPDFFKTKDRFLTTQELSSIAVKAEFYVQKCLIR